MNSYRPFDHGVLILHTRVYNRRRVASKELRASSRTQENFLPTISSGLNQHSREHYPKGRGLIEYQHALEILDK